MLRIPTFLSSIAITVLFTSFHSNADGLSDLKNALGSLIGKTPISATVESSYTEKRGKRKKNQRTKTGLIQVELHDGHQGLELLFSDATIDKLENESNLKEQDEDANTPTLNAVNGVGVAEMKRMLSAAPSLLRFINKAEYLNEQPVTYHEQAMRQINFRLPLKAIIENKDVHEYVDDFESHFSIKIDDNGVPIESVLTFEGSGSAYIFFSMDITQTYTTNYQLIADRLVNVKQVFERQQSSTWGKTSSNGYKILIVSPTHPSLAATN